MLAVAAAGLDALVRLADLTAIVGRGSLREGQRGIKTVEKRCRGCAW
jgi:hypothetical protein